MVLVISIFGCCQNKVNVIYPFGEKDLLLFLNSDDWKLNQVCIGGNCKETINEETYPFGIDTESVVPNYCTKEKGDFYTIGKYHYSGTLKIIDGATIQIIANRPEYEKKEVIQVYKKK